MSIPLHIVAEALRAMASRLDGLCDEVEQVAAAEALATSAEALRGSRVASVASDLGIRLDQSSTRLSSALTTAAINVRESTHTIVAHDDDLATEFGGR